MGQLDSDDTVVAIGTIIIILLAFYFIGRFGL